MSDLPPDPFHGNSTGGGPLPSEIRHARAESAIQHPSWCNPATCPVRRYPRGEVGAHVSPWVVLDEPQEEPGVVGLQVRLWQFAPIADDKNQPEVDVKIRSVKRTLVHFSLDLEGARAFANVITTLARQAGGHA
jgi:hypothetical protein